MDSKRWSLVAFLTYVCVVHTETRQCFCPKNQDWDFIIEAEVSHIDESTSSELTKYELKSTETYKANNNETFGNKVYTNKLIRPQEGPCPAKLETGKQYVLKGKFGEDGALPLVDSCGVLRICGQASSKRN